MKEKELFKNIVDDASSNNEMTTVYILFASLISYDNNRDDVDIKNNCRLIKILIDVLQDYTDNKELQEIKNNLIEYNKQYLKE